MSLGCSWWCRSPPWCACDGHSGSFPRKKVLVWGATFLAFALLIAVASSSTGRPVRTPALLATGLSCWIAGYLLLSLLPDVRISRAVALAALTLSTGHITLAAWRPSWLRVAAPALGLIAIAAALAGATLAGRAAPSTTALRTALHPIQFTVLRGVVATGGTDGGAVAALGDEFLHVNGAGEFSILTWDSSRTALLARRLPLPPLLDRAEFLADQPDQAEPHRFRVTDLLIDSTSGTLQVLVAHLAWESARRCLTLRVSRAPLHLEPALGREGGAPPWETVYETTPCHPLGLTVRLNQTGGQLAWLGHDTLLLTVGDHGFDGQSAPAFAQDTAADYGKVLLIHADRTASRWTMGHRNPQGVVVDWDRRIWISEQGPQGGDELNLLEPGGNYGWPLATYGTNYGSEVWPQNLHPRHHGEFVEPVHVLVPSPAIASIIQLNRDRFPAWQGDFLIGSLRARSLFRVRTRDGRVTYTEQIEVGERIRDLAEGADGRILLWTDSGTLVILDRADPEQDGRLAYGACADCHGVDLRGTERGPALLGVVDRRIAGWPGYRFSSALRRRSGEWTLERLDQFLADPQAFAPGTTMDLAPMADPGERQAIIQYLRRQ